MTPTTIMIVAAEASSSLYAQRLLEHWKSHRVSVKAFGIGSDAMEQLGFERVARAEEMAVVGLSEVLSKIGLIRKAFYALEAKCAEYRPTVVVLMDYPDFNLRLAKSLRKRWGKLIRIVYYVSPQVWAWRKGRVKTIKQLVDEMIVALPFEVDFYREQGVDAKFVGHPLVDEIEGFPWTEEKVLLERSRLGITKQSPVLGLMPGSRTGEIDHHLDLQLDVVEKLAERIPDLVTILMVAPTRDLEQMRSRVRKISSRLHIVKREPLSMISLADVLLCASGTATLNVALAQRPMVVMYRVSAITAAIARTFVKQPKFVSLPNLIYGDFICPELLQENATVTGLAEALWALFKEPGQRARQVELLREVRVKLGEPKVASRVADLLIPRVGS